MQCPVCEHETGKALARCSACDTLFDRELLEELQHIDYLLSWIAAHVVDADAEAALVAPARKRGAEIKEALQVAEARRARAQRAQPHPERLRELALLHAISLRLPQWSAERVIFPAVAASINDHIRHEVAVLESETGGPGADLAAPDALEVVDYALDALHDWREAIGNQAQWLRLRTFLRDERAALLAGGEDRPVPPAPESEPAQRAEPAVSASETPSSAAAARSERVDVLRQTAAVKERAETQRRSLPRPRLPRVSWTTVRRNLTEAAASGALMSAFLYLNAFAIVVAAAVLVLRFPDRFPLWAQFGFIAAVPTVFYLFGWIIRTRIGLTQSGSTLTNIGSLLFAVDLAAIYIFGGLADRIDAQLYGLGAALLCTGLYFVTGWRLGSEFTGYSTFLALGSSAVALVLVLGGDPGLSLAAATLVAAALSFLAGRLQPAGRSWRGFARAAARLPLAALPLCQAAVLILSGASWTAGAAAAVATVGYGQLCRIYGWRKLLGSALLLAAVASSIITLALIFSAAALPPHWLALYAAGAAPLYLAGRRLLERRVVAAWPVRRLRLALLPATALGLVFVAFLGGSPFVLQAERAAPEVFWAAAAGCFVAAAVFAAYAPLYNRAGFFLAGAIVAIFPYTSVVNRLLDNQSAQRPAWLGISWVVLGLALLGLALRLRRRDRRYISHLHVMAHILTGGVPLWLGGNTLLGNSVARQPVPTLLGLSGMLVVYWGSAWAQDRGNHEALKRLTDRLGSLSATVFHWPIALLLPLILAVAAELVALPRPWVGVALAALGAAYVPLGQLLRRRNAAYRLAPHLLAYFLPAIGVALALNQTWPLWTALLLGVATLSGLAVVSGRVLETAAAGLLFIWPFHLTLTQTALGDHSYALAYASLGSIVYPALSLRLAPAGFRNPWRLDRTVTQRPALTRHSAVLLFVGYGLSGGAVVASLLFWLLAPGEFSPWVGVAVPLIVTALALFSAYHLRRFPLVIATVALAAVTYGQGLILFQVPTRMVPVAWILLAAAFMLVERFLGARRADSWPATFRRPLFGGILLFALLGIVLLAGHTRLALQGRRLPTYAHLQLAYYLLAILLVLGARLYRSRRPLFLVPAFALVASTVSYVAAWYWLADETPVLVFGALVWSVLGVGHVAAAALLDRAPERYAHGLYLGGYGLVLLAVLRAIFVDDVLVWTLGIAVLLALASQLLIHTGRHRSFADLIDSLGWPVSSRRRRAAFIFFLAVAAGGFPLWLTRLLALAAVPLAWQGAALALLAPFYVVGGVRLRAVHPDYRWPPYVTAYVLTAVAAALAAGDDPLLILVLALNTGLYAATARIFRQSAWLYLATIQVPVLALLLLRYVDRLSAAWIAVVFVGLGIAYVAIGQIFDRRAATAGQGISPYAWPFYLPGYLLALLALPLGSGERFLAIAVYLAAAALSAVSARLFRSAYFLYPAAWLAVVPYYLALTLTPLPAAWRGPGLLPLIGAYVGLGYAVFPSATAAQGQPGVRGLLNRLSQPSLPFYLWAYPASVVMVLLARSELLPLTLALLAAGTLYAVSSILFRQPVWLFPALLAAHLAVLYGVRLIPTGVPAHGVSVPFMVVTWVVALMGLALQRRVPPGSPTNSRLATLLPAFPADNRHPRGVPALPLAHAWARPFFLFAAVDVVLWQAVASRGPVTGLVVALGLMALLALLTSLWRDGALVYGAIALATLAAGHALQWSGWPFYAIIAGLGGVGLAFYGLGQAAERARPWLPFLAGWQRPLRIAGPVLAGLAVLGTVPAIFDERLATAAALGFAGLTFLGVAYRRQNYLLGYGAIALLNLAWVLLIFDRDVRQPQWYALPAGCYFLLLGYGERRRNHHTFAGYLEGLGAAVLLLTTFIQSLDVDGGRVYFLLLIVESLCMVAWGGLRRVRVPFMAGIVGFTVNVLGQLVIIALTDDILRWIILFVAGIMATALAIFLQWEWQNNFGRVKAWQRTLEEWL